MWDRFWHFLISAFIAYLMILFSIIVDLYWRDRRTPGLIKAIWVIFLIILSYVTALVYRTFEGRAWPFERAKPPVPPRRRDRRIYPRGGRLLARAGNRRRQNVAQRLCDARSRRCNVGDRLRIERFRRLGNGTRTGETLTPALADQRTGPLQRLPSVLHS